MTTRITGQRQPPPLALPLASRRILESTDVDQVKTHLCSVLRPHDIHLTRNFNDLNFVHNQGRVGNIALNAVYYGIEVNVQAPEADEAYLFMLTLAGSARARQGTHTADITKGTVYVFNPTRRLNISLSADNKQLVMRLPRHSVERFLSRELGCSLREPVEFMTRPFRLGVDVPGLESFVHSMCVDLDQENPGYTRADAARHAERFFLSLALGSIPHNYSTFYGRNACCPAPYFVRRAEEFMRANIAESLTLEAIARASGASVRSLQNGFRNFRQ
ncbi:MAG: hypothetical protein WEB93_08125, partial [Sphingomonadales bacterium]